MGLSHPSCPSWFEAAGQRRVINSNKQLETSTYPAQHTTATFESHEENAFSGRSSNCQGDSAIQISSTCLANDRRHMRMSHETQGRRHIFRSNKNDRLRALRRAGRLLLTQFESLSDRA